MKIIAAGSGKLKDGRTYDQLCYEFGIRKLLSHYSEIKHIESYEYDDVLMVDSGGHPYNKESGLNVLGFQRTEESKKKKPLRDAKQECERYLRFLDRHKDKNWVMVEPDYYGHLDLDFVDGFCRDVMSMNPTFTYMRVYHPEIKEDRGSMEVLKKWYEQGHTYIGISQDSKDMFGKVFQFTQDRIKLHGFACTGSTWIENYPFYSADSTSALVVPVKYNSYSIGFGKRLPRSKAIETKDIRVLLQPDKDSMVLESLRQQKKYEQHLTKLWQRRGVTWKD